jgi:hypothetical protein
MLPAHPTTPSPFCSGAIRACLCLSEAHKRRAWSGFGKDYWLLPNYLGEAMRKPRCPVTCTVTSDRERAGQADLVLFEPYAYGRSAEWRRHSALQLPEKRAWQEWVQFGYEQGEYFPLAKEPGFVSRLEINMTYQQNVCPTLLKLLL